MRTSSAARKKNKISVVGVKRVKCIERFVMQTWLAWHQPEPANHGEFRIAANMLQQQQQIYYACIFLFDSTIDNCLSICMYKMFCRLYLSAQSCGWSAMTTVAAAMTGNDNSRRTSGKYRFDRQPCCWFDYTCVRNEYKIDIQVHFSLLFQTDASSDSARNRLHYS